MKKGYILKLGLAFLLAIFIFLNCRKLDISTPNYHGLLGQAEENHEIRKREWVEALNKTMQSVGNRKHRFPDVIGIGVQKCGTAAVNLFLNLHPHIRALQGEGQFFAKDLEKMGLNYYKNMLPAAADHEIVMEKSPSYFWRYGIAKKMHKIMPDLKIIVILCNPIQRALSSFAMEQTYKRMTPTTFDAFVEGQLVRPTDNKHNLERLNSNNNEWKKLIDDGKYLRPIKKWLEEFRGSMYIINGDEFINDPATVIEDLQDFFKIPKLIRREDFIRSKVTGMFCVNRWWRKEISINQTLFKSNSTVYCLKSNKGRTRSKAALPEFTMSNYTRNLLTNYFQPHNKKLYNLLGRRLNW
uniref:heparan sulfate glucosamine 3-O-sulfotransferase 6-like n=1 Tax=Styela clava TaxID=7725 RepID=UPI001939E1C5|nr:heparan sulfate glucosamine 3-O-sulfotransferase 6-like [Styela clava]